MMKQAPRGYNDVSRLIDWLIDLFLVISFLDDEEDKDDGGSGGDDGDDFFLCFAKLHVSFPSFVSLFTTDDDDGRGSIYCW